MTDDSGSLIQGLKLNLDSTLGVRDAIGATLHKVYFLQRTWTGDRPGDGAATDLVTQMLPTPAIEEFKHDIRLREGGAIKEGDIIISGISKHKYSLESQVDGSSTKTNVENFYLINDKIYNVIQVKEQYVTWDVQLRKISHQTRY